jgi:aminoglycoside 3-N-acetyltransferase
VLLIGVSHSSNTSLHLAEVRCDYAGKSIVPCSAPMSVDGHTRWKTWDEVDYLTDDFEEFGKEFAKRYGNEIREGSIGQAKSILFRQRSCVDFAVDWFRRKRRSPR